MNLDNIGDSVERSVTDFVLTPTYRSVGNFVCISVRDSGRVSVWDSIQRSVVLPICHSVSWSVQDYVWREYEPR
jgi:hypothetical protein